MEKQMKTQVKNKMSKTLKSLLLGGSLAWVLTSGTVACNQNAGNSNNLTRGSLQTDGKTLFSSTSIGGQALTFSVQNIRLNGNNPNAYVNNGYYNNAYATYGATTGQNLSFDLTLNRETRNLVSMVTANDATGAANYYQPAYNPYAYGGYNNYANTQVVQMASYFQVSYTATCYLYTCDEVLLSILIQSYNNDTRQIAIRKNMREDRIVNMSEYTTVRTVDQLIREL